jgi:hypothetical protein
MPYNAYEHFEFPTVGENICMSKIDVMCPKRTFKTGEEKEPQVVHTFTLARSLRLRKTGSKAPSRVRIESRYLGIYVHRYDGHSNENNA